MCPRPPPPIKATHHRPVLSLRILPVAHRSWAPTTLTLLTFSSPVPLLMANIASYWAVRAFLQPHWLLVPAQLLGPSPCLEIICPASRLVLGFLSLTQTRISEGREFKSCSLTIKSLSSCTDEHTRVHLSTVSASRVASSRCVSPSFRLAARKRWRYVQSSFMSYLRRIAAFNSS